MATPFQPRRRISALFERWDGYDAHKFGASWAHASNWGQSALDIPTVDTLFNMEYSSVTRVTLVLLLLLGVQSVSAGSCETSYEILVGFSNRSEAIISNSSFTVRPRDGNGQAMQIADARLALWGFQEATRWGDVKCIESDSFPDIPPKWQAHLFKAIQLADMNCTVKRYHELAPGTNVNIATINFQATTSLYPDLVISYNLSTASKAGNYTFYDPFERIAQFEYGACRNFNF